ncbi:MAG: ABC transporter ATP-binding protein [Anaerolineae bacterium]|jgi:iron complex transport system ATP-binding protein|nr:ABC transporter ATP-binding protein [Anaerolineae bacterium]
MAELHAHNLMLSYDDNCIIPNLTVTIPTGQITVLVGANGCGKSTLLRGISRLLKPKRGSVVLNGQDIWRLPTKQLAKQLGILPQSPTAPEGLTVHELVAQGRYPHQSWLQQWSREDERITQEALAITDLTQFADRSVDTLSGGQRQRAWIAMTLAQDSDTILLDEPTTFLDLAYQIDVLDLLHDLNVTRSKTIVMVLHDLNHACRYADNLIALHDGRILAQGYPSDIVTEDMVHNVFGIACRIIPDPLTGTPLVIPSSKAIQNKAVESAFNRGHQPVYVTQKR